MAPVSVSKPANTRRSINKAKKKSKSSKKAKAGIARSSIKSRVRRNELIPEISRATEGRWDDLIEFLRSKKPLDRACRDQIAWLLTSTLSTRTRGIPKDPARILRDEITFLMRTAREMWAKENNAGSQQLWRSHALSVEWAKYTIDLYCRGMELDSGGIEPTDIVGKQNSEGKSKTKHSPLNTKTPGYMRIRYLIAAEVDLYDWWRLVHQSKEEFERLSKASGNGKRFTPPFKKTGELPKSRRSRLLIRDEHPDDFDAVDQLSRATYTETIDGDRLHLNSIRKLRKSNSLKISLVAVDDGVIGHIGFSPIRINKKDVDWYALGPLSVRADRRRQGVAHRLIKAGIQRLRQIRAAGCVVIGDAHLFDKFKFKLAPRLHHAVPKRFFRQLQLSRHPMSGMVQFHSAYRNLR